MEVDIVFFIVFHCIWCARPSEALQKEEADKEAQWLQSLDDDQSRSLSNEVRTHIIQQHVEKLRQKKLRYRPPLATFLGGCPVHLDTKLGLHYAGMYLLANNRKCLNLSKGILCCGISQERYVFVL